MPTTIFDFFGACVHAVRDGVLIRRESRKDKEFHFQDWIGARLEAAGQPFESGGRNSYPDYRIVPTPEGYEVKGLAYPGRWVNYDANSQVPSGYHNGRMVFYVFGRYPREPDGNTYPVTDLVVCHGDFLNADHTYVHKNKNVKGFGSYGDVMIRDRKMYVAPTPYGLLSGVAHTLTLVLPDTMPAPDGYVAVGHLERREVKQMIVGYRFDLRTNEIAAEYLPNPSAGKTHVFTAWRLDGTPGDDVALRDIPPIEEELDEEGDE